MHSRNNRLLESLSTSLHHQVLSVARAVEVPAGAKLYSPGETNGHTYFITSGVASIVVSVDDGSSAEIGMIGCEGMAGGHHLLGPHATLARCVMQTPGSALRVSMQDMRRLFGEHEEFRQRVLEFFQYRLLSLSQISGCNKLHETSERLARWLLSAADRTGSENLPLTQESLSQMLGTRRTTVALVAGTLQRSGMIRYRRGMVQIVHREALTQGACDCYGITRRLMDALYREPLQGR